MMVGLGSCNTTLAQPEHSLKVTAYAYNSASSQTDAHPNVGAWGDHLMPGMKVIAVSHDLIKMGLKHNTKVRIEGLDGEYLVKDTMSIRWHRKIDIYMGNDVRAARLWGKRTVTIHW